MKNTFFIKKIYKIIKCIFLLVLYIFLISSFAYAQQRLSGVISDENGAPIPYAKIYVKNSTELRTVADVDGYYEMRLFQGEYFLVIKSMGYKDREAYVTIKENTENKDYKLFPNNIQEIEDVNVSTKKSNPGREIMLKVIKKRDSINLWNYPHTVQGYIKASEKIIRKEKEKKRKKNKKENTENNISNVSLKKRKKDEAIKNNMNLIEVDLTKHYGGKNKVKEIRNAYKERGSSENNLYYTTTVKSNFNFFQNLLRLDDLHQTPISSPISSPGILSYKYRLVEQYEENGRNISKIKIIPRNIATTTLKGYIYVIDTLWLVQKLEFTLEKGNLLIYDYFSIEQEYNHPGDSLCVLSKQKMTYGVKYKNETSICSTESEFSEYNFEPIFPKKYFNNELSVIREEAFEKDSTFWRNKRKSKLTSEEIEYITINDSIEDYQNRKEYLDSIDANFNKVTALKVLWWGVDHRNRNKKTQWTINSLAAFIRPIYIAGPRLAPGFSFFKKWKDERFIDSYSEFSIGFLNKDPKGFTNWSFQYDPFHFGILRVNFSHSFEAIRAYDALSQIYRRDNFIETTDLTLGNNFELINGLYLDANISINERRSIDGYRFSNTDDVIENNDPTKFDTYQAFIFNAEVNYTPQQKYIKEPNRKVLLGSNWPKFYLYYEKGIEKIFGSDVNHDYLLGGIMQTFKIGLLGTSSYNIKSGLFLNTKSLKDADQKFHRRSDPIWFSNPLHSFQALDSTLPSEKIYLEAHFIHHDNGAIINKIPFMKKTRIGLVLGTGALYVPEFNWEHYEVFAGLERNFKFSRRRLRIGIYGVLSDGNQIKPQTDWKISFAILDNRDLKWNF